MSPTIYKRGEKDIIVYNDDSFNRSFENLKNMYYILWSYMRRQTKYIAQKGCIIREHFDRKFYSQAHADSVINFFANQIYTKV